MEVLLLFQFLNFLGSYLLNFYEKPFLFGIFFVALPSIFLICITFANYFSAVISQYQSKFLSSNQDKDHSNLYYKLMAFLTFGYIVAIFFLIILFNFQEEILNFLISSSFFSNILYRILSLSNRFIFMYNL